MLSDCNSTVCVNKRGVKIKVATKSTLSFVCHHRSIENEANRLFQLFLYVIWLGVPGSLVVVD